MRISRSLNSINIIGVLEEREQKGIKDGLEASPLPANKSSIELGTEIQVTDRSAGHWEVYYFRSRH
jgi:hypothetical protein